MEFKEFVSGGSRLAAEDEWELFGRLEAGMLASELLGGRAGVRHDATEEELRALVEQGNRAAEQLWRAGLGMAVKVASNLAGFCGGRSRTSSRPDASAWPRPWSASTAPRGSGSSPSPGSG
ncbi:hypothetical protein [Acidipropionibacterium acidipropionici]|uniref:hypothetical protein n=1 Tax=Acidipropionibacterium acidipropionici TaxID=1748 RepID=UPI001F1C8978|nr:hypothetical protein [Acidipropionibacterium acidipropionici]